MWGISGREGERDWDSRLKEWETEHKRGSEMAWVGNYHWGGHMRIWKLTEMSIKLDIK